MRNSLFLLLSVLIVMLITAAGCVNGSPGSSSPLVHGLTSSEAATQTASASNARVVKVTPGVVSISGGKAEKLQQGMTVPNNAILRSDATGRAQLAFGNGTTVNIAPNSEIALADLAPAATTQSESPGKGLARLLGGGIGKSNASASSQATIGVRGLK